MRFRKKTFSRNEFLRKIRENIVEFFLDTRDNGFKDSYWIREFVTLERRPFISIKAKKVLFVGDLHGDFDSLYKAYTFLSKEKDLRLVFLGDYVDRGEYQLEVLFGVLTLKYSIPDRVFLIRGNHESKVINMRYGLAEDIVKRLERLFGIRWEKKIWLNILNILARYVYKPIPLAVAVDMGDRSVIALHGGPPPEGVKLQSLPLEEEPRNEAVLEVLWSDPHPSITGRVPNPRGAGSLYGKDVVEKFLESEGYDVLIRAHQSVLEGVQEMFEGKLYTVFSCRYYKINPGALFMTNTSTTKVSLS